MPTVSTLEATTNFSSLQTPLRTILPYTEGDEQLTANSRSRKR